MGHARAHPAPPAAPRRLSPPLRPLSQHDQHAGRDARPLRGPRQLRAAAADADLCPHPLEHGLVYGRRGGRQARARARPGPRPRAARPGHAVDPRRRARAVGGSDLAERDQLGADAPASRPRPDRLARGSPSRPLRGRARERLVRAAVFRHHVSGRPRHGAAGAVRGGDGGRGGRDGPLLGDHAPAAAAGPRDGAPLLARDDEQRLCHRLRADARRPDEHHPASGHARVQAGARDGGPRQRRRDLAVPVSRARLHDLRAGPADAEGLAVVSGRRAALTYALSAPFVVFALFPFAWMLVTSIKKNSELYDLAQNPFLVRAGPTWDHYRFLFQHTAFPLWLRNSAIVAIASTAA